MVCCVSDSVGGGKGADPSEGRSTAGWRERGMNTMKMANGNGREEGRVTERERRGGRNEADG